MVWQLRNWYCANMAVRGIESAFIHDNRPSGNIAPKGGNTAPKKPNGKAGLPNGVSGNPISSNGSTRTGGRVSDRAGIKNRPPIAGKDQKSALSALVERVTRHTIICKLKNLKAEDTARTAVRALRAHKDRVHTTTMDNGKGFCRHTRTAKALAAETCFCRPYHSWGKGPNEDADGLIRQYFPKQTDFRNIGDREIRRVQDELNRRPRKTLGCETPSVLFLKLFQSLVPECCT